MFEEQYLLDDDSLNLLNSNKWKEFCEDITTNTSVFIHISKTNEISLMGKKPEVKKAYERLQDFYCTIVKATIA
jgi:hypothetical protein